MASSTREHIWENFESKSTEELLEIWETNDRATWSDEAFEVIREILMHREKGDPGQWERKTGKTETPARSFGGSELDNYLVNAFGISRTTLNVISAIGVFIFGWLIAVVYDFLGRARLGWAYVLPLIFLLVVGHKVEPAFALIGTVLYIIAWVHANVILSRYQKQATQRLADIENQREPAIDALLEKGLILDKVMRKEYPAVEAFTSACGMPGGTPILLNASGQVLLIKKRYNEAFDLLSRALDGAKDEALIKKINKGLKKVRKKLATNKKAKEEAMNDELKASGPSNVEASVSQPTEPRRYRDYREVPWHRRSGSNSFLILLNFLTAGFIPGTLLVCIFVLTGDIYFKEKDEDGNLKTWGWGNKIVAVILLLLNIVYLAFVFMR